MTRAARGKYLPILLIALLGTPASANGYREKGVAASVAGATMSVTPPRHWNQLSAKPGKRAETWTLDGEQLNDVTFYGGIGPGEPLVRERHKKREPLPKLSKSMLLAEVPELLEGTYRAYRKIGAFTLTGAQPGRFLDREGIRFTYEYTDADELPRKGEGRATLIDGKLYMVTFDAPRTHFYDRTLEDFRSLADAVRLAG